GVGSRHGRGAARAPVAGGVRAPRRGFGQAGTPGPAGSDHRRRHPSRPVSRAGAAGRRQSGRRAGTGGRPGRSVGPAPVALIGLGVTGGIGAYKAVELTRLLQKRGHVVRVVMTRAARRFVGPLTFEAITRAPVITSQFAPGLNASIEHIALASDIDALVVAPATANIIGKFAGGIADDFLSSLYLATTAP